MEKFDIVIVGGGIGGGALGTVLARAGLQVLVLEKSDVYRDHVRGEWMAPWGVLELQQLGLYDTVMAGGGHHLSRHQTIDGERTGDAPAALALDLTALIPGVAGPLCIGHPALCQLFADEAVRTGATLHRSVSDPRLTLGDTITVEYRLNGEMRQASCRWLVGADGRGSQVRRQAGLELHRDPTHHLFAGMLVEGAPGWPADLQVIGAEGDVHFLVFPQDHGRLRLYLGYSSAQPKRFNGSGGQQAFLDAFRLASVPESEHIVAAEPAGPCNSFPNEDTWTDAVAAPGVVLIGDAAGSNDPIIGQGLSITLRDVRLVADALLGERDWSAAMFEPYEDERCERMRRLRFAAKVVSAMENEFTPAAHERRHRAAVRQMQDATLLLPIMAPLLGPDNIPAEAFEPAMWERLFASS